MARYRFSGVPRRCPQCGEVALMDVRERATACTPAISLRGQPAEIVT